MIDLDQGPCAIKRLRGCGCGKEYVAITPPAMFILVISLSDIPNGRWAMCSASHLTLSEKSSLHLQLFTEKRTVKIVGLNFTVPGDVCNSMQYCGDILKPFKLSVNWKRNVSNVQL